MSLFKKRIILVAFPLAMLYSFYSVFPEFYDSFTLPDIPRLNQLHSTKGIMHTLDRSGNSFIIIHNRNNVYRFSCAIFPPVDLPDDAPPMLIGKWPDTISHCLNNHSLSDLKKSSIDNKKGTIYWFKEDSWIYPSYKHIVQVEANGEILLPRSAVVSLFNKTVWVDAITNSIMIILYLFTVYKFYRFFLKKHIL